MDKETKTFVNIDLKRQIVFYYWFNQYKDAFPNAGIDKIVAMANASADNICGTSNSVAR